MLSVIIGIGFAAFRIETMKRTAIAVAWFVGATVPVVAALVFLFGCCVLPFHAYLHRAMPLCELAADVIRGEHHHHDDAQQPLPAREKQEPVKRVSTELPRTFHLANVASVGRTPTPVDTTLYRSFISLGAIRCDQDVGLLLLSILLI